MTSRKANILYLGQSRSRLKDGDTPRADLGDDASLYSAQSSCCWTSPAALNELQVFSGRKHYLRRYYLRQKCINILSHVQQGRPRLLHPPRCGLWPANRDLDS